MKLYPDLLKLGHLREGVHVLSLKEIEDQFCFNDHRLKLFKKALKAIKNLAASGVKDIYIDGSFVEDKACPNDIDGCWLPTSSVKSSKIDPVLLDFSRSREQMKMKYGVDFFPANVLEGGTGKPFLEFFQKTRDGKPKGILKIKLE